MSREHPYCIRYIRTIPVLGSAVREMCEYRGFGTDEDARKMLVEIASRDGNYSAHPAPLVAEVA